MRSSEIRTCVVDLSNVTKQFGVVDHRTTAIRNVSVRASLGELLLLLGPSGSGKTTLLTLIAGVIKPTGGTVSLFGRNIEHFSPRELQELRALRIGFVFQNFLLIDSLTVIENVGVVLRFKGVTRTVAQREARGLLNYFQIEHLAGKFPATLSQGEKQRVAVARAIANDADIIIADEPTASLDTKQGLEIIQFLHAYAKKQKRCVIVASHDLRITEFADRVIRLEDGALSQGY